MPPRRTYLISAALALLGSGLVVITGVPLPPFLLFVGCWAVVAVIAIAKVRRDLARRSAPGRWHARLFLERRIYWVGLAASVALASISCLLLMPDRSRPTPEARMHYQIVDPFTGTVENRDLTPREFREQYESGAEHLKHLHQGEGSERKTSQPLPQPRAPQQE